MKKHVCFLAAGIVITAVSLAGCGSAKPQTAEKNTEETTQEAAAPQTSVEEPDANSNIGEVSSLKAYFEEIYSEKDPKRLLLRIDLKWLQVDGRFAGADKINQSLTEAEEQNIANAKENMGWLTELEQTNPSSQAYCSYESGLSELSYYDSRYVSFCQKGDEYAGGAHGMPYQIGYAFDLQTGDRLSLGDVVDNTEDELKEIVAGCFEEMIKKAPGTYWEDALDTVRNSVSLDSPFYLTEEGIAFYYPPYELASYADGFQTVNIPYRAFAVKIPLEKAVQGGEAETAQASGQPAIEKEMPEGGRLEFASEDWGLSFGESGTQPRGNASAPNLAWYDAYYVGKDSEKVIYLTFDCGFENGNTAPILDALKKHDARGTFFVVGHFLETAPELVKRMVEEGHTVGNHTYSHPDMAKISDLEAFQKELDGVADRFYEITGTKLSPYYRPPQGKCNGKNLEMAQELGYNTLFWSLAYVDWNQDKQPSREEAINKLTSRIHPGAIVLLHNTSSTNGKIMDELLTRWEEMGYAFRPLSDLTGR